MPVSKHKVKQRLQKPLQLPSILVTGALLLLVGLILLYKYKPQAVSLLTADGQLEEVSVLDLIKEDPTLVQADTEDLPEAQLERALSDGAPVLVFFHSNSCLKCVQMIEVVDQVYPRFSEALILVDVNVYESRNNALLKKVKLQFIPTLIFYDRSGQEQVYVGEMEAEQLQKILTNLVGDE